jgi:CheY-like chemotaxis protein
MFSVEVPVAPASTAKRVPERAASAAPLGSFNGLPVLAIDNDPAILDGMNTLLSGWGCAVQVASNGEEAEKCASDPDHRPAVIIADYHLDEGDGLAVIGALRSMLGSDIPAILLTADRSLAVRDAAVEAGITVLHKPLKPAALRALLTQWR